MLYIFSEPHIWQFRLFEHQSSLRGEDYRSKKTTGWKVTLWKSKEPRKLIKYMYNFQIKRGNRKSLTSVHCNWNVPFCLLSLKIRGECRDGPWDVFVASQCFGSQVLSNHPGKGTSSLKMSKNEDHFTIFFGKKLLHCITYSCYWMIQGKSKQLGLNHLSSPLHSFLLIKLHNIARRLLQTGGFAEF